MDNTFTQSSYNAQDLSGIKVAHDLSEFNEGSEVILTLKDRGILDEDEDEQADELTNIQLEEKERLQKNLENKKKKPGYNPYDDEEFLLGGAKKSLLPQYEEDTKPQGFVIGSGGKVDVQKEQEKSVSEKIKAHTLSYEKMQEIKDYYTQEEVNLSFKKPKKKKKKDKLRKRVTDEEPVVAAAEPQESSNGSEEQLKATPTPPPKTIDANANFVDDDELQQALSRTRRAANKQRQKLAKKMTPEDIARSIAEQRQQQDGAEENEEQEGGLVLSEMSEFVNSLGNAPVYTPRESLRRHQRESSAAISEASVESMQDVQPSRIEEVPEDQPEPEMMEEDVKSERDERTESKKVVEEAAPILEEPLVSKGLAATLSLLNQKGLVSKPSEEQIERDRVAAERMRWIAEQKRRDLQRERERERERQRNRERDSGRSSRDKERQREREREREREKELEEREAMREFEKRMENYKPDVKLEYVDEYGRQMNTKEAFRFMSHRFHGKTSGKAKTEKRMKKLEEELRLNMMSSTDTPLNLATKLLERQQRTGTAHVVLSVGNHGVVAPDIPNLSAAAESSKAAGSKRPRAGSEDEDATAEGSKKRK